MSEEKIVGVRYIGNKPVKRDTVGKSKTIWLGRGDVQKVPNGVAAKLLQYPTVWQLEKEPWEDDAPGVADDTSSAPETGAGTTQAPPATPPSGGSDNAGGDEGGEGDGVLPEVDLILGVIEQLDPGNPEHITNTGRPKKAVVDQMLQRKTEKKDFDAALKKLKEQQEAQANQSGGDSEE